MRRLLQLPFPLAICGCLLLSAVTAGQARAQTPRASSPQTARASSPLTPRVEAPGTSPADVTASEISGLGDADPLETLLPRVILPEPIRLQTPSQSSGSTGNSPGSSGGTDPALDLALGGPSRWTSPEGLSGSLQVLLLLTVLSMAPAVLLMTTCYVRIIVVLGLLRQAIGLPSLPPGQVMTSIALFITLFVMTPVWTRVYDDAIAPYTDPQVEMSAAEAWEKGTLPIRNFMALQIAAAGNHDDVMLFYRYAEPDAPAPSSFEEVPLRALLPAFMLSELKTAFLMGFKIYLPFLVVDLVVATVTISMGMLMLPPSVISLPFKLLLFVLVDGWRMVVEMLLISFGTLPVT